jgi:hypothetical protein
MLQQEQPISAWCCFKKGLIDMRVSFASDTCQPGESLMVNVQVGRELEMPSQLAPWQQAGEYQEHRRQCSRQQGDRLFPGSSRSSSSR